MGQRALDPTTLRIIIAAVGAIVLALIYVFGQPKKPGQGRRTLFRRGADERIEPTLGEAAPPLDDVAEPRQGELDVGASFGALDEPPPAAESPARARAAAQPLPGRRPYDKPVERIVSLFVAARPERPFRGPDLVVAAEKAGLEFGDLGIFHRLLDGKPELGPIFSVANMIKPGKFDMRNIDRLETPGISFFMTLPGPLPALDAWDAMLPTAQRLAELLDGMVLDEERSTLGRQRIAHIRDELRAWDRRHEGDEIKFGR
ncbi:MAG: cell division protein ZipA [Mizugakiibacter sp.]|uniref:cell division protein ZipA n=1 Tax=Mizugakiibacter sp. TaxID=1972610 RepID=UPI0031BF3A49|nr:cell division protein ZipA [Xanthomonadaceae bacterium]